MKKKSFALGYSMIVCAMIAFACISFYNAASMNIIIPQVSALRGFNAAALLTWQTVGGLAAAIVAYFVGGLVMKKGVRPVMALGAILGGINYGMIVVATSQIWCGLHIALNQVASIFYVQMTATALIGNWFPRKRGAIMGIATCTTAVGTMLIQLLNKVVAVRGIEFGVWVFALAMIVWGVTILFWVKEKPQDVGLNPDNKPISEDEAAHMVAIVGEKSPWTTLEVLKNPRLWCIMICWGLVMMTNAGVGMQAVPFMVQSGVAQPTAVTIMAYTGLASLIGSLVSGFLEERTTARISSIVFIAFIIVGVAFLCFGNSLLTIAIGLYTIQFVGGAPNNLQSTTVMEKVGVKNFSAVYRVIIPVGALIRSLSSSILAVSLGNTGGYRSGYIFFGGCCIVALVLIIAAGSGKEVPSTLKGKADA